MPLEDIIIITSAIGHHDEKTGTAIDPVSAALILADKTDVRRNRVQNPVKVNFDIHDRVNYAALSSKLEINNEKKIVQMNLELDDNIRSLLLTDIPETLGCSFENIMQSALHDKGSELFAKYCCSFRKAVSIYSVFSSRRSSPRKRNTVLCSRRMTRGRYIIVKRMDFCCHTLELS